MKRFFIGLFFTCLSALLLNAQGTTSFSFKSTPFLQAMTEDGVTIMWLMNKSCTSYVLLGETINPDKRIFASQHGQIDANLPVQKIRLSGLKAGRTYYYRVVSKEIKQYQAYKVQYGDSVIGPVCSFTLPSANRRAFSFLAFNDLHDKPAFVDTVCRQNPDFDFVFYNGDILGDIYNEEQILNGVCRSAASAFAYSKPFFYTRGNHETRGPESRSLSRYLDTPDGRYFYSFTWGNTCFVVLDTGEDKEDTNRYYFGLADYDRYRSIQAEWLKEIVESKQWKNAEHRVVCGHIPATADVRSNGEGHGNSDIARKITPILNKARVDLYICGHTHQPEIIRPDKSRTYPLVIGGAPVSEESGKNTTFIQVSIDKSLLKVELKHKDGTLIDSYEVK